MEIINTLVRDLKKFWWILLFAPLITTSISYFLTRDLKDEYVSTAQLSTGYTTESQFATGGERINLRDVDIKFNNLIQNLRSKTVLSLLSYRLIIHDIAEVPFRTPEDYNQLEEKGISRQNLENSITDFQRKLASFESLNNLKQEDKKLNQILDFYGYDHESLQEKLKIWRINFSDFINIEFNSENPYLSAFAVNSLSEEFIRYNRVLRESSSVENVKFLEKLVNEKNDELANKTRQLNYYKSTNEVFNYQLEAETRIKQIELYENSKSEEEKRISSLTLSLANIDKRIQILEGEGSKTYNQNEIIELRKQINDLNERYINGGMKNPELLDSLQNYRDRYNNLQRIARDLGKSTNLESINELELEKNKMEVDLAIAQTSLAEIDRKLLDLRSSARTFATKEAAIEGLEREVELATEEYLSLLDKLNELKKKIQLSENSINQVLIGEPADEPQSSKKILIVFIVYVLSMLICITAISFNALTDFSIKNVPNLKRILSYDNIGQINKIDQQKLDLNKVFNNDNKKNIDIERFRNELRKIRHEIISLGKKCLMLTSTKEKEGKSFLILSLAYSLSLVNKKVLIIDTNFKNNSLTRTLVNKVPNSKRLLNDNNSRNNGTPQVQIQQLIIKTTNPNIDIIGCFPGSDSPIEILDNFSFNSLIEESKSIYDFIFLEGPALNNYSDTKELAPVVDGIVTVFSAKSEVRDVDRVSLEFIDKSENRNMGGILNMVKKEDLI